MNKARVGNARAWSIWHISCRYLLFGVLGEGDCDLVGARCGFLAATDAPQCRDNLICSSPTTQGRYALKIAMTAAGDAQVAHDAVRDFDFNEPAACADRGVFNFHSARSGTRTRTVAMTKGF